jgi:hypothetical protein
MERITIFVGIGILLIEALMPKLMRMLYDVARLAMRLFP